VVDTFSGVRPLFDDRAANPSAVTRDYVLDLDAADAQAPLLSAFGGKITTFRRLAEHALDKLAPFLGKTGKAWTRAATLPGGDFPGGDVDAFADGLARRYPFLPVPLARHYGRLYGTRAHELLKDVRSSADLGRHFGGQFHECEAHFLRRTEWAETAEDMLDRRTKHGLRLTAEEKRSFAEWMERG
jgi:glycerol-3-phosphate dehydrogenase